MPSAGSQTIASRAQADAGGSQQTSGETGIGKRQLPGQQARPNTPGFSLMIARVPITLATGVDSGRRGAPPMTIQQNVNVTVDAEVRLPAATAQLVDHSKRLLAAGESIKSTAFALGFSSAPAFCYAFRRAAGMTPGVFRSRLHPGTT
jgi:Helix-turn-helix domain